MEVNLVAWVRIDTLKVGCELMAQLLLGGEGPIW
jgi:hypothetical protein